MAARTTSSGLVRRLKTPCCFMDFFSTPRPAPTPATRHRWAGHVVERLGTIRWGGPHCTSTAHIDLFCGLWSCSLKDRVAMIPLCEVCIGLVLGGKRRGQLERMLLAWGVDEDAVAGRAAGSCSWGLSFNKTSQSLPELRLERLAGPGLSMIWLALGREGICWYPFVRRPWSHLRHHVA